MPPHPANGGGALEAARLELLGRLLPAALHELSNPLVALVGTVDLLLAEAQPGPAAARLELVQRTAAEVTGLVRSLQRLTRERLEPPTELGLGAFTRETADLAVRFSNVKDVACDVTVERDTSVHAASGLLRQALLALLLDAVQAAPSGGGVDVLVAGTTVRVSHGVGRGASARRAADALGARIEALPGGGVRLDVTDLNPRCGGPSS